MTDEFHELTPYQYASNDPITNIDLDGLEGIPTVGGIWNGSFLAANAGSSISNVLSSIGNGISNAISGLSDASSTISKITDIASGVIGAANVYDHVANMQTDFMVGSTMAANLNGASGYSNNAQFSNNTARLFILNNTTQAHVSSNYNAGHLAAAVIFSDGLYYISDNGVDKTKPHDGDKYGESMRAYYTPTSDVYDDNGVRYDFSKSDQALKWLAKYYDRMFEIDVPIADAKTFLNYAYKSAGRPYNVFSHNCANVILDGLIGSGIGGYAIYQALTFPTIPNAVYSTLLYQFKGEEEYGF